MASFSVIFDLDGTLIDTAPDLVHALNHVLTENGLVPVDADTVRHTVGFGARRMIEEGLSRADAAGRHDPDVLLPLFLDYYAANIAVESRPFAGAVEALQALRSEGARLGICTNKREGLSRTLIGALGLAHLFDAIVGRDTFAYSKPDPRHLLGAIERAGGNAARAVMVGDSETDIATAKAATIPVIAVSFGYSDVPVQNYAPDAVIGDYAELVPAIRRLLDVPASG